MNKKQDCYNCGEYIALFQTHDDGFMEKIQASNNKIYKTCERCFIKHIE